MLNHSLFSAGVFIFQNLDSPPKQEVKSKDKTDEELRAFLKQAGDVFQKEGEKGLRDLMEKNPQYWEAIEKNLHEVEEKQREVMKKLLKEVRELQKSVVEWLPDYPVTKKVGVIINGDSKEERHTENTERAIRMLQKQGFAEIFVAQHAPVKATAVRQYPGDKTGVDRLFADLKKTLIKDSLVFVYGTGHGTPAENGAIALNEPIGVQEVRGYMRTIKERESRIVGVFDSCYSGVFPEAIIEEEKLEGVVFSPGVEGKETECQFFAPYFFEGLEEGIDLNKDRKTEVNEAFVIAMQIYRHRTGLEAYGEYMRSKTELTLKNFDRFMASEKTVIIDIGATWCGPCRELSKTLAKLTGLAGEQVDVVTITDDKNPDAQALYKKLGAAVPKTFPTLLIKGAKDKQAKFAFSGAKSLDELMGSLQGEYRIKVNEEEFKTKVKEEIIKEAPNYAREISIFVDLYGLGKIWFMKGFGEELLTELKKTAAEKDSRKKEKRLEELQEKAIRKMIEQGDYAEVVYYFEVYKEKPYAQEVLEKAVRKTLQKAPAVIFEISDKFKKQPNAKTVFLEAAAKRPDAAFDNFEKYKDQPYAKDVLIAAAKKDASIAFMAKEVYQDQPYAAEVMQSVLENSPGLLLKHFVTSPPETDEEKKMLEKAAIYSAEKDPFMVLAFFEIIERQPYAGRILELSARNLALKDPNAVLMFLKVYQKKPYRDEVIGEAARNAAETDPETALQYFKLYFGKISDALEILEKSAWNAAEKDPVAAFQYFKLYQGKSYAPQVLTIAAKNLAEKAPGKSFEYYHVYKDKISDAPEILEITAWNAAESDPEMVSKFSSLFKDKSYAKEVLKRAKEKMEAKKTKVKNVHPLD